MNSDEEDLYAVISDMNAVFGGIEFCVTTEREEIKTPRYDRVNRTKGTWVSLKNVLVDGSSNVRKTK